jgi:predicted SprT family Zn-dependent metalloprotease
MHHWGLEDWEFRINRRRRFLGMCFNESRRIELSQTYIRNNDSEHVRYTLLHEIAHALAPNHGHDNVWYDTVMLIGGRAKVKCSDAVMPPGNWQAVCPNCSKNFSKLRKPKWVDAFHCVKCGEERGTLIFERVQCMPRKALRQRRAGSLIGAGETDDRANT